MPWDPRCPLRVAGLTGARSAGGVSAPNGRRSCHLGPGAPGRLHPRPPPPHRPRRPWGRGPGSPGPWTDPGAPALPPSALVAGPGSRSARARTALPRGCVCLQNLCCVRGRPWFRKESMGRLFSRGKRSGFSSAARLAGFSVSPFEVPGPPGPGGCALGTAAPRPAVERPPCRLLPWRLQVAVESGPAFWENPADVEEPDATQRPTPPPRRGNGGHAGKEVAAGHRGSRTPTHSRVFTCVLPSPDPLPDSGEPRGSHGRDSGQGPGRGARRCCRPRLTGEGPGQGAQSSRGSVPSVGRDPHTRPPGSAHV